MEAYIGTIMAVGFNFAPRGWMLCQGQELSIAQNTALFALLGTTYGGNGQTTFALPDLRGRTLVGQGQGQGLTPVELGQAMGADNATMTVNGNATVTLTDANLPPHTHPVSIAGDQFSATSTLKATMSGPGASSQLVPPLATPAACQASVCSGPVIWKPIVPPLAWVAGSPLIGVVTMKLLPLCE